MAIYGLRVVSFIFAALAFVPAGAHLFSMLNKLKLDGTSYLAAQRAYDGWSLFGSLVLGALLSSAALAVVLYRSGGAFGLVALAFIAIGATQFVFWSFTFPANRATQLDHAARQLGDAQAAMGIFARGRRLPQRAGAAVAVPRGAAPRRGGLTGSARAAKPNSISQW